MNFLVSGGTGFVGRGLTDELVRRGHSVTIVTRQKNLSRPETGVSYVSWTLDAGPDLVRAAEQADAVINLAGESVIGRWTSKKRQAIIQSRARATRLLIQAITKAKKKPECFISASAIGFYGDRGNEPVDEKSLMGLGFLAETCHRWEDEARAAEKLGVRVALVRIGLVLGLGGGALGRMLGPFKLGLGGPIGSGEQWVSWIHLDDLVRLIEWLAVQKSVAGPVNATAPNPLTMKDFARSLGRALGKPAFMPVPGFVLRLGLGEMADMLLKGQKVFPKKAIEAGFAFSHPDVDAALADLVGPAKAAA